jgi:hypothetical protein
MRVNCGGQLAPEEVVGRDDFIAQLWQDLEHTSIVLTAERRTGKTSVIKRMHGEPRSSIPTFFQDLERVHTALEFVEEMLRQVHQQLSTQQRVLNRFQQLMKSIGGTEIGGVLTLPQSASPHWKALLVGIVDDLMAQQAGRIVFFWDEFPQMLHNIATSAPRDAMEILDVLRSLRQHHADLRMLLTGSIGLHTVIALLQRNGYRNAPTNDMVHVTLPPLSQRDAEALARALMQGESIEASEPERVVQETAAVAGNIPFYIHQVVGAMRRRTVGPGTPHAIAEEGLRDPQDAWGFRHYRTRISRDYEADDQRYALAMLDALSVSEVPLDFRGLMSRAKTHPGVTDDELARAVLKLLQQDHYVVKASDTGAYTFRTPLIARWWRLDRDL